MTTIKTILQNLLKFITTPIFVTLFVIAYSSLAALEFLFPANKDEDDLTDDEIMAMFTNNNN